MWPFTRRGRAGCARDLLTEDVDLAEFAPFAEAERYLLVFPVGVGLNYVLVVVYQARSGERVHAAHAPGDLRRGGGMENFIEWIATDVRRRDPQAIALLTSWAADRSRGSDELMRSHFAASATGRDSTSRTVLVDQHGRVENVLSRDQECLYAAPSFFPRLSPAEWSEILGVPVRRFTASEWEAAADDVDPDRRIRDAADQESADRHAVHLAFLREMGVAD